MRFLILIILVLLSVNSFASRISNNLEVGKTLKVSNNYLTPDSFVDGSFENGTSQWTVGAGSLTATTTEKVNGSYSGAWAITGTGTLDLCTTINSLANTTIDSEVMIKSASTNLQVCSIVNSVETGCKDLGSVSNWTQAQSLADAAASGNNCLRIKKTVADDISVFLDNGQVKPNEWSKINTAELEGATYVGYAGWYTTGSLNYIKYATAAATNNQSQLFSVDNTNFTKYTILKTCEVNLSAGLIGTTYNSYRILHFNSAGTEYKHAGILATSGYSGGDISVSLNTRAIAGDYFVVNSSAASYGTTANFFSISATAVRDNVVQAYQDGVGNTATYSMDIGATTTPPTKGTPNFDIAKWQRLNNGIMRITYLFNQSTGGSTGSGTYKFPLPSGYKIDTNRVSFATITGIGNDGTILGSGRAGTTNAEATNFSNDISVFASDDSNLFLVTTSSGANTEYRIGSGFFGISGSIAYTFTADIPIQGWSSQPTLLALPNGAETSYTIEAAGNSGQSVTSSQDLPYILTSQSNLQWDGTGFVAPVDGTYEISGGLNISIAANSNISAYVNTSQVKVLGTLTTALAYGTFSGKIKLTAGQRLTLRPATTVTVVNNPVYSWLSIVRLNGKIDKTFVGNVSKNLVQILTDEKASGLGGGTNSAGANTRVLNTSRGSNFATLASNQFTLPVGEYQINASATAWHVGGHQIYLYNVTDAAIVYPVGDSIYSGTTTDAQTPSRLSAYISISSQKTYELRHWTQNTIATYGLGSYSNSANGEVFSRVEITKLNGQ